MTIAIALQVHDGVVLASDSAMTLSDPTKTGPESVLNVYNNANKIYNLRKGLPIGAVVYGAGSIGASSIATLAKDLRKRFSGLDSGKAEWKVDPDKYTVEEIAIRTREFLFDEHFKPLNITTPGVQFGITVAGYSTGAQLSEAWSIEIADGQCAPPKLIMGQGTAGCYAGGDPELFCRINNGLGRGIRDALLKGGIQPADLPALMSVIEPAMAVSLVEAPMPIQDAVDLSEFFVSATATFTRFKRGAGTVGGPVESAAITKHEGFKWVRRKHYFETSLNPGDGE